MSIELHISELRGFLNALERVCCPSRAFYSHVIPSGPDENSTLANYFAGFKGKFEYTGSTPVSYEQVKDLFQEYVFSCLSGLSDEQLNRLAWHLIEYYGLASTAVEGPFNPLVQNGALLLSVAQHHYVKCAYFVVRVPGHLIITGLAVCA
jgi:hypothetical protein